MEQGTWDRVKEVFGRALERPAAERAAFLDETCAGEPALRREVEDLLAAHDEAAGRLGDDTEAEGPGTRIGPYKLLQKIGEGGFGVVYMAEQREPLRRRVALKVIKLGMDTRQVIARFEAERQALAMMDHPGIARVLDAGATEQGRPYFVMELVGGVPITEFCDQNHFNTDQRLELFAQVCRAVQHAHQKGIIHRDLKPSNVLVAMHDGAPTSKVIDFGIAKATSGELTDKTLFTEFRQFIGTPQYMSPEQATLGGLDVDTRSDIYSLGVLLYELLTGATPVDARRLREAAFDELKRIITEEEPVRPSTRVSTSAEGLTTLARTRQQEPTQLLRSLRGDLDWIVLKALEKDRGRRYATAQELIADLERHRDHEPVLASPPGAAYRVRKFVRRHRGPVAAAAALALMLVAGLLATGAAMVEAERGRALAQQHAERAAHEARKQEAVASFLCDMLSATDPESPRQTGPVGSVEDLLNEASERLSTSDLPGQGTTYATVALALSNAYASYWVQDRPVELASQAIEALGDGSSAPYLFADAAYRLVFAVAEEAPCVQRIGGLERLKDRAMELLEPGLRSGDARAARSLQPWCSLPRERHAATNATASRRLLEALDDHPDLPVWRATAELNLGTALAWLDQEAQGRQHYEVAAELLRGHRNRKEVLAIVEVANDGLETANSELFADLAGRDEVVELCRLLLAQAPRDHATANAIENLCWCLVTIPSQGDDPFVNAPYRETVLELLRGSRAIRLQVVDAEHPYIGNNDFETASCLASWNYAEAATAYEAALRRWERSAWWGYYEVHTGLAILHLEHLLQDPDAVDDPASLLVEAERLVQRSIEWAAQNPQRESIWNLVSRTPAAALLAQAYRTIANDEDAARRWQDRHRQMLDSLADRARRPGQPGCVLNLAAQQLLQGKPRRPDDLTVARELARRAVDGSRRSAPGYLDTLAQAEFALGEAATALALQREAVALIPAETAGVAPYRERLQEYEQAVGQ